MSSIAISWIVFAGVFAGALLGIALRRVQPENHGNEDSKDVGTLGMSIIATMTTYSMFFIVGCNPVISIAGAQFPVWILCLLAGILIASSLRPVFVLIGIDEWMTPRLLTYFCLALVSGFVCWLVVWR